MAGARMWHRGGPSWSVNNRPGLSRCKAVRRAALGARKGLQLGLAGLGVVPAMPNGVSEAGLLSVSL